MIRKIGRSDYEVTADNGDLIGYRASLADAQLIEDQSRPRIKTKMRMPVVYERSGVKPAADQAIGKYDDMLEAYRRIIRRGACVAFRYY